MSTRQPPRRSRDLGIVASGEAEDVAKGAEAHALPVIHLCVQAMPSGMISPPSDHGRTQVDLQFWWKTEWRLLESRVAIADRAGPPLCPRSNAIRKGLVGWTCCVRDAPPALGASGEAKAAFAQALATPSMQGLAFWICASVIIRLQSREYSSKQYIFF